MPEIRRPIRVLELRSVRGTGGGPDKTILTSAAHHDPTRVAVTVCYIRDARDEQFHIDRVARASGLDYVEIRERHSFDLRIWQTLKRLVREREIDIVHAHEYKTDLLALLLARMTGVMPVATVHGWSGDTWRETLYYRADKRLLARYPLLIAVSEPIRQTLIAHGANPARVRRIRNGIDHHVFKRRPELRTETRAALGIPDRAMVIGAVGRVEPEKRFELLLDAVAALPASVSPFVVIAGDGSERGLLQDRAHALGLTSRVKMLGHRHDVLAVHHVFDIYAQTSTREGIPNAVLEAMAVGTPIVATNVGGTSELIEDGVHGLLVPSDDRPALTAALQTTLDDPRAAASRASAARDRIERELSFAARLHAVEGIYAELLAERRPSPREAEVAQV